MNRRSGITFCRVLVQLSGEFEVGEASHGCGTCGSIFYVVRPGTLEVKAQASEIQGCRFKSCRARDTFRQIFVARMLPYVTAIRHDEVNSYTVWTTFWLNFNRQGAERNLAYHKTGTIIDLSLIIIQILRQLDE